MGTTRIRSSFDGTTGRSDHGGRRTHIIRMLRDAKTPMTVAEVAESVGVHLNTARFHLESLVDAGLAERTQETRNSPGRPKVLYIGTLPNQTHERAQGYRLLAEMLATTVAQNMPNAPEIVFGVGRSWGKYLTEAPTPFEQLTEAEVMERLVAKLDALWFAPEPGLEAEENTLTLHNCPFLSAATRHPEVVCTLHSGLVNGALEELGSELRMTNIEPLARPHECVAHLERINPVTHDESTPVHIIAENMNVPESTSKTR